MTAAIVQLIALLCQEQHITSGANGTSGTTWVDKRCVSDVASINPKTAPEVTARHSIIEACWRVSDGQYSHDMKKYNNCLSGKK